MDSILDNQEVTADVLNAISADLGRSVDLGGDDLKFSATEKFGADKLNSITGDITGAGVLLSGNGCNVIVSGDKIYVQDGIIVFNSGAKKTITANVEIGNTSQTKQYIYAYNNTAANMIQLVASEEAPSVGDYVMLAEVTGNTVVDKRTVSFSKVGKGTTVIETHTFTGDVTPTDEYTECWRVQTNIESPKLLILSAVEYRRKSNQSTTYAHMPKTMTYDCEQELWYFDTTTDAWTANANFPRSNGGADSVSFVPYNDPDSVYINLQVTVSPGELIFYAQKGTRHTTAPYTYGFVLAII